MFVLISKKFFTTNNNIENVDSFFDLNQFIEFNDQFNEFKQNIDHIFLTNAIHICVAPSI